MKSKANVRYWAVIGVIILTVAILIGCAARKPFWGDPETGLILQYRLSPGQTLSYEASSEESQSMEMAGNNLETISNTMSKYSITGKGLDKEKNILSETKLESITFDIQSPQGEMNIDTAPVTGKSFGLSFSVLGEELDYTDIDSTMEFSMGQAGKRGMKDLFRNPLQDLPDHPVKVGDSWTDKDSVVTPQGGLEMTIVTNATLTLNGFEEVDGIKCVKILSESKGTIDGEGQQMGMDVALEGDIEASSTFYFAYQKGVFVKMTTESFTEMTAALSGQVNMTIPITQEGATEIKLTHSTVNLK